MHSHDSNLQLKWLTSESDIPSELWERCFPEPFEGRWWYQALEQCGIQDQFTFFYGVVSRQSEPIAIAPAFVMDVPIKLVLPPFLLPLANLVGRAFPSALYQRTFFIGSPCSDEGRVGMVAGTNQFEVLRCVNHAMQLQADQIKAPMRVWKDMPQSYAEDFARLQAGLFPLISFPGTLSQLPNASKQDYLASLKSSYRNNFRKKLRTSSTQISLDVEVQQHPDSAAMDEIFGLFWQTYEKGTTKFERLNRRFFDLLANLSLSHFVLLRERENKRIVAFMLCFILGEHAINKFIGIDYKQPKEWFLYFRLWDAAVDWAVAQKATSIQSGQTGYTAKIRLGHELMPMTNYCLHDNPVIHWIYAMVAKTVNWDTLDEELALYLEAYPEKKPQH